MSLLFLIYDLILFKDYLKLVNEIKVYLFKFTARLLKNLIFLKNNKNNNKN